MDDILRHHIQHSANGCKALETNTKLAESIKVAKTNVPKTLPFNLEKLLPFYVSKLEAIENARVRGEQKLKKAAINVCEKSIKELKNPSLKHQKNAQRAINKLNEECDTFHQLIVCLSKQFATLEDSDQADNNNSPNNLHENLLESTVKVTQLNRFTVTTVKEDEVSHQIPETKNDSQVLANQLFPLNPSPFISKQNELSQDDQMSLFLDRLWHILKGRLSPIENYTLLGEFGAGGQGTVHQAQTDDGTKVALKVISITEKNYMHVVWEVLFVSNDLLAHSNIISAIKCSIFKEKKQFFMALSFEPMLDGDLSSYCYDKKHPDDNLEEDQVACILKQTLSGLAHLHSIGIVHNDIKPRNILLNNGIVKIADFGKAMDIKEFKPKHHGTIYWVAPEVVKGLKHYKTDQTFTVLIDIWALGITLYELLEGYLPFINYPYLGVYDAILCAKLAFSEYKNFSPALKKMFSQMTKSSPCERSSAKKLLKTSFIKSACSSSELAEVISKMKAMSK